MKKTLLIFTCLALALAMADSATANVTVNVSGQATVYFAGQTAADMPLPGIGWGDQSDLDTLPPSIDVTGYGGVIGLITATGGWSHTPFPANWTGPDGYGGNVTSNSEYDDFGISMVGAPLNSLVGVFLTDAAPSLPTPSILTLGVNSMTTPGLQQGFVIGSNLGNIIIPVNATRLFFGLHNGYEWTNNSGEMTVTVSAIPAPGALMLGSIGVSFVGWLRRRRTL